MTDSDAITIATEDDLAECRHELRQWQDGLFELIGCAFGNPATCLWNVPNSKRTLSCCRVRAVAIKRGLLLPAWRDPDLSQSDNQDDKA